MGVTRWVPNRDQVADRLQEGRFGKTEKSQLFQSLEASFPLLSLLNRFFSPHKNTFLRINGNSLEKLHVISLVNLKFKKENKKKKRNIWAIVVWLVLKPDYHFWMALWKFFSGFGVLQPQDHNLTSGESRWSKSDCEIWRLYTATTQTICVCQTENQDNCKEMLD